MQQLEFSATTITTDEWHRLANGNDYDKLAPGGLVVESDTPLALLAGALDKFECILVVSRDFNDGRIFSIARQIRLQGFPGRLMVVGQVLPDQYEPLQACGFDDVLVLDDLAARQVIDLDRAHALAGIGDLESSHPRSKLSAGKN